MAEHKSIDYTYKISLKSDNGAEFSFNGRLVSESSLYDEDSGMLTRLRLFATDSGEQVYSIVSGAGANKERRNYMIAQEDELYRISDGINTLRLPPELLFAAVFGLCGIDADKAQELMPAFEENLRNVAG